MANKLKTRFGGQVFLGILLIGLGILFLADNLYYLDIGPLWRYWPFILVLLGIQKLVNARDRDGIGAGIWPVFIGLWLFVSLNHIWGLDFSDSWPFLIIAWGVSVIWKSLLPSRHRQEGVLS
ncbi:MAG: DUF5668 domain-containing protein [Bacteroidota bacterium]